MSTTYTEYRLAARQRAAIQSENRSRRLRGLPALPVPPKPEVPLAPVAYGPDGTYEGRLRSVEDCPEGCTVRWEPAQW